MQAIEYLKRARDLLDKPENWTGGTFARKADWELTQINSDDAYKLCLTGAILKVSDKNDGIVGDKDLFKSVETDANFQKAIKMLVNKIGIFFYKNEFAAKNKRLMFAHVSSFNDYDNTSHQDIINLLDRTIAETTNTAE